MQALDFSLVVAKGIWMGMPDLGGALPLSRRAAAAAVAVPVGTIAQRTFWYLYKGVGIRGTYPPFFFPPLTLPPVMALAGTLSPGWLGDPYYPAEQLYHRSEGQAYRRREEH
jgi:hypothetical protein